MKERVYITETGERVRERDGLVEVGLSVEAQASLGVSLYVQMPEIGSWVLKEEHLFVVEGTLTAAEFYAPIGGRVVSCAASDAFISDWLVVIRIGK